METTDCEAMIQDCNITLSQFSRIRQHIKFSTGNGFQMQYRQNERKELETGPRSFGPEPIFGEYKYEADDDGSQVETVRHWSTNLNEELQSAIEIDVLNRAAGNESKTPAMDFPETVEIVVGMDHGQGSLRAFAKLLLTSKEERKKRGDLSYGCPIVKIAHVQCKKDTYRIIKNTLITTLQDSITHLRGSRCVIVCDKQRRHVQTFLVPVEATAIHVDDRHNLCYTDADRVEIQVPLDMQFHDTTDFCIDASIKQIKPYITGDLALYALLLGKPNSSGSWCTWCDARSIWFGIKDKMKDAITWTLEKLRTAKVSFDNRTARKSTKNVKGVTSDSLLDIEPEDYIFPVLHVQMGLVNTALDHLVTWIEKHVEKLPDGHAKTRKDMLAAEQNFEKANDVYIEFISSETFQSLSTLNEQAKAATGEEKEALQDEIKALQAEMHSHDKARKDAKENRTKARKAYKEMRSKRGKPESSFAYLLDKLLEQVGAKRGSYHGGDLQGNSARTVMENSAKLFDGLDEAIDDITDDNCKLTKQEITDTMQDYRNMFTLLGACFSYLRQILPSEEDLKDLAANIDGAHRLWNKLGISCTPKAHGLFDGHAYKQHKRLGGIGDKGEDFVEKGHQLGLRDERRTWNIRNFEKQQRSQIKHMRRGNQIATKKRIEAVRQASTRKLKRVENGGESLSQANKRAKKEVKKEERQKTLELVTQNANNSN